MSESALVLSIVIPVYNEQGNLAPLAEALLATLRPLGLSFEILFVDDGSRDQTWQRISALSRAEPEIGGLRLSRNFGHQGALLAGLHAARGAAVISMDGDMQHPPEIVPRLIEAWQGGAKVVLTRRHDSQTTPFFKRITSSAFYWLYSRLADTPMEQGSSDFRLLDRQEAQQPAAGLSHGRSGPARPNPRR